MKKLLLVMLSLSLSLSACSQDTQNEDNNPTNQDQSVKVNELRSSAARAEVMEGMGQPEQHAKFGFKLYHQVAQAKAGQNVAVSPASLMMALGMVGAGAQGQTAQELLDTLGFDSQDQLNEELNAAEQLLLKSTNDNFVYEPANQLWIDSMFTVKGAYLDDLATYYDAGVNTLALDASAAVIAKTINGWVSEQTHDLIKEVVTADNFSGQPPRAIWANAFYLNAKWSERFPDYLSGEGEFVGQDGQKIDAWFMNKEDKAAQYMEGSGFKALRLPFDQGQASMLIILPDDAASLSAVEEKLDAAMLAQIEGALAPTEVKISVPRFKFDVDFKLKEVLSALGIKRAFTTDAEFGGLSDQAFALTEGIQKLNISVDEEGTVGAVVSIIWGSGATPSEETPKEFKADHPFIFAVTHHQTKQILMMGRVTKPEFDQPKVSME